MAQWEKPIEVNLILLSGVYPNQPQPDTAWKIEVRKAGVWETLDRGVGDWYDRGRYAWGGPEVEPRELDAVRVSVFSKDNESPIKSIHFRGEEGYSWVVACAPPIGARIVLPRGAIRAGQPVALRAETMLGDIDRWEWSFSDWATG